MHNELTEAKERFLSRPWRNEIVPAFRREAAQGAVEAWQGAADSATGSAKLIGSLTANGANVAANTMSSLEAEGVLPQQGSGHNTAEVGKAGAAAHGWAELFGAV